MSEKNEGIRAEILLEADIPALVILREDDRTWMASAIEYEGRHLRFLVTPITGPEIHYLKENRVSIRGLAENRPWREAFLGENGYYWGQRKGASLDEDDLADAGAALDLSEEGAPDRLPDLTEVEVLYEFDGPMIVTLSDGESLWMANARSADSGGMFYMASRVTEEEVRAITEGRLSLRAAHEDRPWVDIDNVDGTYRFGQCAGDAWPENMRPKPGIGLETGSRGLPDRISDIPEEIAP